ncbi:MAG: tol-pal system protein YbgF [Comamonas sp.]
MSLVRRFPRSVALAALALCSGVSHAALFEDSDARHAIIELRQRVDQLTQSNSRNGEDTSQVRRSLLDFQAQLDGVRNEVATLRGENEALRRQVAELQRGQKDLAKGMDDRLRQFEPSAVNVDGQEFKADPAEKTDFDAALNVFRSGKFADAAQAFSGFVQRYPNSGYVPSARFWLGNAQYANRDYKSAIDNFKLILTTAPKHMRAPDAALSIANCQIELKDTKGARKTLEDLVKSYPDTEAAKAAKERLSKLK